MRTLLLTSEADLRIGPQGPNLLLAPPIWLPSCTIQAPSQYPQPRVLSAPCPPLDRWLRAGSLCNSFSGLSLVTLLQPDLAPSPYPCKKMTILDVLAMYALTKVKDACPLEEKLWKKQESPRPGPLFEGNPVGEGTTRRGTDTPVHHPQRPAGSTHS